MKKILVILLLGAGFVTVASANTPLDCTNNTTNPCCVDVQNINQIILDSVKSGQGYVLTTDDYMLSSLKVQLIDTVSTCEDEATYLIDGTSTGQAVFSWVPGDWDRSIKRFSNSSSAK